MVTQGAQPTSSSTLLAAAPGAAPVTTAAASPDDAATSLEESASQTPEPVIASDATLIELAQGEAIEIFDQRPDKPFDRDTELRLTGEQLAERGATDLATALALLPDVTVRDAGRGGFNIDVRGARKGAVAVLVDGVLVTDPFYGTFDVSTIPVTDIVQIRVSTTPASPIDGPGGPGGVIEVLTRDAIGSQLVIGRITADSMPTFGATATARASLSKHWALRLSASGLGSARDFELPNDGQLDEGRHAETGSARLEYRNGDRRVAIDGFLDNRHYIAPPSDTNARAVVLMIDRETSARASVKLDDKIGSLQIQGQGWTHYLLRRSRQFLDSTLSDQFGVENLEALRSGGSLLATKPFLRDFRWAASVSVDFEKATVSDIMNDTVRGKTTVVEAAGDLQFQRKGFRIDVAGGVAVPFGVDADPWPEVKAVAKYRVYDDLELTATGAYKGRLPSLRERFDTNGNEGLKPERIAHGELRAIQTVSEHLRLEVAPYYKRSNGTIRSSTDPMDMGMLVNLGDISFYGADAQAKISPFAALEVGGGYGYIRAHSSDTGDDPLDRLPHHRWDSWVRGNAGSRLSALARVKYFGDAINQGTTVEGYALIDASITAKIAKSYMAVLRIDDLLDEAPETRPGYHMPGRVFSVIMQGSWE